MKKEVSKAKQSVRVLFSAHGLPKKIIQKGDPYQWQVEKTAKAISVSANLNKNEWRVCYQSRVGPLEWIGPSLDEEIKKHQMTILELLFYQLLSFQSIQKL